MAESVGTAETVSEARPASVAVVVPVRNGAGLLGSCLESVVPQAQAAGAQVVVVDDGSTDETSTVASSAGAAVIRLSTSAGPYHARNVGWRSVSADIIVFTDVRCRAEPGWLERLVAATDDPHAALVTGVSVVHAGRTWTGRVMHRLQPVDPRRVRDPFLPWAAAANLAIRRSLLETLDGFVEVRSGGDIDLCWRAQLVSGATLVIADDAVMVWEPRQRMSECLGQWYRYGSHHPALYARFRDEGATLWVGRSGPLRPAAREIASLAKRVATGRFHELDVEVGVSAIRVAEVAGRWVGARRLERHDTTDVPRTTGGTAPFCVRSAPARGVQQTQNRVM